MYTTKQQKTSVSRIQPTSKSQQTLMRQIDSSNTVLQRKLLQYHSGDINKMLNMDVCFTTQGIDCKFIDGKKNGANWISETEVLRIPSHSISGNVMNYAKMACHLNIKFKAGTINNRFRGQSYSLHVPNRNTCEIFLHRDVNFSYICRAEIL